ncbi:hypothetical protein K450DRAFT_217049 [Umbelopsis ramanniana AG]|uniref:Nucleoporin NUP188 n=1 Tax=Umbelopsis ramanniana AG TaxID=1314678 RepID=A0AAD5HJR1_UMBRA|nr:uncharacterized protein K450DRAFT_217049 [Umbelopsis ramanniana AG]KAI8584598.1 hypothetical protein K450DRAFT_217049 [Umbelopsis ramanniana AG]
MSSSSSNLIDDRFTRTYQDLQQLLQRGGDNTSLDRLQTVLEYRLKEYKQGLDAFGPPSPQARSKIKGDSPITVDDRTIQLDKSERELICKLSDHWNLNEIQCASIWDSFKDLHKQLGTSKINLSAETFLESKEAIFIISEYYYSERIAFISSISCLMRLANEDGHPLKNLAHDTVTTLRKETTDNKLFANCLFDQFRELRKKQPPAWCREIRKSTSWWAKQTLKEQRAMLEVIFLCYHYSVCPPDQLTYMIHDFKESDFSRKQATSYLFDAEADHLLTSVIHLCLLISIEVLDPAVMSTLQTLPSTPSEKNLVNSPDAIVAINTMTAFMGTNQQHSVFLLAWSTFLTQLSYLLDDNCPPAYAPVKQMLDGQLPLSQNKYSYIKVDSGSPNIPQKAQLNRIYVGRAFKLDVFQYITIMVKSSGFQQADPNSFGYRYVTHRLLDNFLTTTRASFIPQESYDDLVQCTSLLYLDQADLCLTFWKDDFDESDQTSLLATAANRFPLQFTNFTDLLASLTGDAEGCHDSSAYQQPARNVFAYLSNRRTVTAMLPDTVTLQSEEADGGLIVWSDQQLLITGVLPGRKLMITPKHKARLLSAPGEPRIVRWNVKYSGWLLLALVLEGFTRERATPSSEQSIYDFDNQLSGQNQVVVVSILELLQRTLEVCPSLGPKLVDHIEQASLQQLASDTDTIPTPLNLLSLLQRVINTCASHPTYLVQVMTPAIRCLTALLPFHRDEVWSYLVSAPILPRMDQLRAQHAFSSSLAMTDASLQIQHILSTVECVNGKFSLLIAFLDLVKALVVDIQRQWWLDAKATVEKDGFSSSRRMQSEVLAHCLHFLMLDVFPAYSGWRYKLVSERFDIGTKILEIFIEVVQNFKAVDASSNSMYILNIKERLINNFLHQGNAYQISPLLDILATGTMMADARNRIQPLEAIQIERLTVLAYTFVKKLLTLRLKMVASQDKVEPSSLERFMLEQTVGDNKSDLILIIAKLVQYPYNHELPSLATDVLTRLFKLAYKWKSVPSFVGFFGDSEQAQKIIRSYLEIARDTRRSETLLTSIWQFIIAVVETQPGLAMLFLECGEYVMPSPKSAVRLLEEEKKKPNTQLGAKPASDGKTPDSAVRIAIDLLSDWQRLLMDKPTVLSNTLRFLAAFWTTAFDHYDLVQRTRSDNALWDSIGQIVLNVEQGLDKGINISSPSSNGSLRRSCCNLLSKAYVLRIIGLEVHLSSSMSSNQSVSEVLPAGVKALLGKLGDPAKLELLRRNFLRTDFDFELSQLLNSSATSLLSTISSSDTSMLIIHSDRIGTGDSDCGDMEGQYGEAYIYDLALTKSRLNSLTADLRSRYLGSDPSLWNTPEAIAIKAVESESDTFMENLIRQNFNWSVADAQLQVLRSCRQFLEISSLQSSDQLWSTRTTGEYELIRDVLKEITSNPNRGQVNRSVQVELIELARGLTEHWIETTAETASQTGAGSQKQFADKAYNLLSDFCSILRREQFPVISSVSGEMAPAFHRTIFEAILLCVRAVRRGTDELSTIDSGSAASQNVTTSLISVLEVVGESFVILVQRAAVNGQIYGSDIKLQLESQELSRDIIVTLSLIEEVTRPVYGVPPNLWLSVLDHYGVIPTLINLFVAGTDSAMQEVKRQGNSHTIDTWSIPSYAESALCLLLALAQTPLGAERLASHGLLYAFADNALIPLLQQGKVNAVVRVSESDPNDPNTITMERNPLHSIWCQKLAVLISMLQCLSSSQDFALKVSEFLQITGPQINRAMSTHSDLSHQKSLTTAHLDEVDKISMILFYLANANVI